MSAAADVTSREAEGAVVPGKPDRPGRWRGRGPSTPFGSEPFVVELDRFQGPLDLLLHLIRSQDVDIFDIPIARITDQFQRAIESGIETMPLDRAGEFLELAATLIRIKVQLLLPRPGELEWDEDPRADLVRRLLEYEYFQEVAHVLASAESDRRRHFGKGCVEARPAPQPERELEVTLEAFLDAAREVPEPAPPPRHRTPSLVVTVEEKIALVRGWLRRAKRLAFEKLFASWDARSHVVASLLACLELAKQQVVRIEQTERFGSIWLFPGSRGEPVDEAGGEVADAGREVEGLDEDRREARAEPARPAP